MVVQGPLKTELTVLQLPVRLSSFTVPNYLTPGEAGAFCFTVANISGTDYGTDSESMVRSGALPAQIVGMSASINLPKVVLCVIPLGGGCVVDRGFLVPTPNRLVRAAP